MKASLQLRENQKPYVRAKVPLSILGVPMISGVNAGSTKELCLHLGTFWDAGPALKFCYKPNDSWNPFSILLKTGTGEWGSPANAPMTMTAEINLLGRGSPSFALHFKPKLGDFTLKQTARSSIVLGGSSQEKTVPPLPINGSDSPVNGDFDLIPNNFVMKSEETQKGINDFVAEKKTQQNGGSNLHPSEQLDKTQFMENLRGIKVERLLGGVTLSALTTMPVRKHAHVKLRWGLKVPSQLLYNTDHQSASQGFSLSKLPFLCLEKISIENVEQLKNVKKGNGGGYSRQLSDLVHRDEGSDEISHIRGMCYSMKRQLHLVQAENMMLKKTLEDMGSELQHKGIAKFAADARDDEGGSAWKETKSSKNGGEIPKREMRAPPKAGTSKSFSNNAGTSSGNDDVSEELKKAIRGASSNGFGDK